MSLTIRTRLTLWYTAVLCLVLAASAWASYVVYQRSRLAQVDDELARADSLVARAVPLELEQGLTVAEAAHDALEDLVMPGRALGVFDARRRPPLRNAGRACRMQGARHSTRRALPRLRSRPMRACFALRRALHQPAEAPYVVGVARAWRLSGGSWPGCAARSSAAWWRRSCSPQPAASGSARGALRPVALMAGEARRITERTPGSRLTPPRSHDELFMLAEAFNGLLGRLEQALAQQRQFMADASHELRTPVSVARTAIEVSLARSERSEAEYRESLTIVGEQMRRLSRLVEDMFTLARADVAPLPLEVERLYLDELVDGCVREARMLDASKGVEIAWTGPQDVETTGDERRLRQMLMNLLANAVRHTPKGASVRVELAAHAGAHEISVRDSGFGIPVAERERIFERFVRLDAARGSDGAGLGLSIAQVIAEAHGGSLSLAQSDPTGSTFVVRLPGAAA